MKKYQEKKWKINFSQMENNSCIIDEDSFLCKHDEQLYTGAISPEYTKDHIKSELGTDIHFMSYDDYKKKCKE